MRGFRRIKVEMSLRTGFLQAGALGQFLGVERPAEREFAAANLAITFAQFVFVKWHDVLSNY